jgi:hypothetical protein
MKKSTGITEIKSKISFPKRMLRKLVSSKSVAKSVNKKDEWKKRFSSDYEYIECSSILLPVEGRLDILLEAKHPESICRISIPVQSGFLVTCTKQAPENYKVTWACSLS